MERAERYTEKNRLGLRAARKYGQQTTPGLALQVVGLVLQIVLALQIVGFALQVVGLALQLVGSPQQGSQLEAQASRDEVR